MVLSAWLANMLALTIISLSCSLMFNLFSTKILGEDETPSLILDVGPATALTY